MTLEHREMARVALLALGMTSILADRVNNIDIAARALAEFDAKGGANG